MFIKFLSHDAFVPRTEAGSFFFVFFLSGQTGSARRTRGIVRMVLREGNATAGGEEEEADRDRRRWMFLLSFGMGRAGGG